MLSLQHAMCSFLHCEQVSNKLIAGSVYPDAIMAYIGSRIYSHFERSQDGIFSYYMEYPKSMQATREDIKKIIDSVNADASILRPCAIGEISDLEAFYKHNDSFVKSDYKRGVLYHLHQDMISDTLIRKEINCTMKFSDYFIFDNIEMNGKEIRSLITDIEQHGLYVLASKIYDKRGITTNQDWCEHVIRPALLSEYPPDFAESALSFMHIRDDLNKRITMHDWSKLNDGPLGLSTYEELYNEVEKAMTDIDIELQ